VFKETYIENIIYTSEIMKRKGVSPIISVVVITATLMVILVVASFFATNLLEIQMQSSEFEQAKTAILLLDKTIIDVSLRPGAASSVQFNQRSGGIGMYEGEPINMKIINASNSEVLWSTTINPSYVIKYHGGSMVPAAEANLTNPGGLIVDMSKPLGYARIEAGNGVWIVLDYNRVRVTANEELGTIDIYLIRLEPGRFGGSGTVSVRVQNMDINVTSLRLNGSGNLKVRVEVGGLYEEQGPFRASSVRVIEVRVRISIV